jgi:G:T-mismatch repair DNA endonuclease (very short patch repair protein)
LANKNRDRRVNSALRKLGWRVLRIWEHDLKNDDVVIRRITRGLGYLELHGRQ